MPPLFPRESRKAVLIYGKEQYMWDNKSHIISTLLESFEVIFLAISKQLFALGACYSGRCGKG